MAVSGEGWLTAVNLTKTGPAELLVTDVIPELLSMFQVMTALRSDFDFELLASALILSLVTLAESSRKAFAMKNDSWVFQ